MRFSIADFNCNISVLLLHFLPFTVNCSKYETCLKLELASFVKNPAFPFSANDR